MKKPKHAWMVRGGNDNVLADQFKEKKAVAIGWRTLGNLSELKTRDQFKERYQKAYPNYNKQRESVNVGVVYRFVREIQNGDYVLSYIKDSREVLIGIMEAGYEYQPKLFNGDYPHIRQIQWRKKVSRDDFSEKARSILVHPHTIYKLDTILDEIHGIVTATDETLPITKIEVEEPPFYDDVKAKADELIADLISNLDPFDFQDLVAAVLEAMGFHAVSSPPGPDGGIDIIAYPDTFGFEQPRIKAQVKRRKNWVSGPEMREFLGALRDGDKGLYVSTGGFTPDATQAAEQFSKPLKLLDRDDFIHLMLEHYEALAPEFRAKVPLRKVWVPTE